MNYAHGPVLMLFATLVAAGCRTTAPVVVAGGPPSTDIWLFERGSTDVRLITRVTNRDGYDNQPMFTEDGSGILFVSSREGAAHTHLYDVKSGNISQLTFTDADKYSPTPIPGTRGRHFSVVHTDTNVTQGLWRYSIDGSSAPGPVADVDMVAYYTWAGPERVLFWRLASPPARPTVQLLDIRSGVSTVVAEDSAYSFKAAPSGDASTYLARWAGRHAEIRAYDWASGTSRALAPALAGGNDYTWTPDGHLLMMDGGRLYTFEPGVNAEWKFVADLGIRNGSRLAVSPDGARLAVVGAH